MRVSVNTMPSSLAAIRRFGEIGNRRFRRFSRRAFGTPAGDDSQVRQHRLLVRQFNFAVNSISAEVHQLSAALVHPLLHAGVRIARPIFRVRAENQRVVRIEIELAGVQVVIRIEVVIEMFAL